MENVGMTKIKTAGVENAGMEILRMSNSIFNMQV